MKVAFYSLNNTEISRLLNGKNILPKKELKATPTIFEKLNFLLKMKTWHVSTMQMNNSKDSRKIIKI